MPSEDEPVEDSRTPAHDKLVEEDSLIPTREKPIEEPKSLKWEEPDEEGLIAVSPVRPVSDKSVIPSEDRA